MEAPPSSRGQDLGGGADPLPYAQLYDRAEDRHELDDIAQEEGAAVADLSDRLLDWMLDVEDPIGRGPVVTPYYERAIQDLLTGGT